MKLAESLIGKNNDAVLIYKITIIYILYKDTILCLRLNELLCPLFYLKLKVLGIILNLFFMKRLEMKRLEVNYYRLKPVA